MKWRGMIVLLLGLSQAMGASATEETPRDERLDPNGPAPLADECFATAGAARFRLAGGRLSLDPVVHRKGSETRDEAGVFESLRVTADRGIPSLHYVRHTDRQQLVLSVRDAREVRIESWLPRSGQRSLLEQPARGELRWTLGDGGDERVITGATLLHVRAEAPERFDHHYDATVRRLLRGSSLRTIDRTARAAMLERLPDVESPAREAVVQAVRELAAPERARRIAAERQILRWGTPAVPLLESLDDSRLGPEQQARLHTIRGRLGRDRDDTPASLAMLLINDRGYWNVIATRLAPDEFDSANRHLATIGLPPLPADRGNRERIAAAP